MVQRRLQTMCVVALVAGAPACTRIAGIGDEFVAVQTSDAAVDVSADALEGCSCTGSTLTCSEGTFTCASRCLEQPEAHCELIVPSNSVDRVLLAGVSVPITVSAATVIDTTNGAITGGLTRAAGPGIVADIGYTQVGTLGVFAFDSLEVATGITLRVIGSRPAVFLVRNTVRITGTIDASGNQTSRTQPGPGGGVGGEGASVAGGCSPGAAGTSAGVSSDSGGGGGGAGAAGGKGGNSGNAQGGAGGTTCLPLTLEPLVGGSGGGIGSKGAATTAAVGGGAGGALQISSLTAIVITGTIDLGGGGGGGGPGSGVNAGAGGGGGSGGALLLEAPVVDLGASSIIAANGGGGGGAGNDTTGGTAGENGARSATPAMGGAAASSQASDGGNGGANTTPAVSAMNSSAANYNAGGGGGAVGRIFVRAYATPTLAGTLSPPAATGAFRGE